MDTSTKTIDDFISKYPREVQVILEQIRQAIYDVVPQAKEKISYGIPTLTLNGKNLVHFSAYEKHIGFYPGAAAIKEFENNLKPYKTSKGTVQFPIDQPIPFNIVREITSYVAQRNINSIK